MSDTAVAESGARLQNFLERAGLRGFPWKTAIILYTISYGWFWNVRNSYWADDWTGFVAPSVENVDWNAFGFAPWLSLNEVLFNIVGPSWMRLAIFMFFFASGLFVYAISGSFSMLTQFERSSITLLFLLLPFNTARVSLMTFHYSQAYFYFFVGWYLLAISKTTLMFLLACLLFFFSFQMHSLVLFFVLPLLYFLWQLRSNKEAAFKLRLALLALLPLLYIFGRTLFWSPSNSYHQISFTSIFSLGKLGLTTAIMVGLPLLIFKRRARELQRLLPLGFFVSLLGIAPYVLADLVGVMKNFPAFLLFNTVGRSDWFSRHLTLQPLGASLIFVGFLGVLNLRREKLRYYFFGVLLSGFVIFNVGFGFEYVVDYAKQQSVVEKLESTGEVAGIDEYLFADQTTLLNARGRLYRPRDWWGLVWSAYGLSAAERAEILTSCDGGENGRFVEINGPDTHWQALKNWVGDGDMGFKVTIDDTPGACKPELMQIERVSGAIPILFYFTGAKN
jgi:hypothetical protein